MIGNARLKEPEICYRAAFTASRGFGGGQALNGSAQFLSRKVTNLPVGNSTYSQVASFKPTALSPWINAVVVYPDGSKESNGLSNDGNTVRLRFTR